MPIGLQGLHNAQFVRRGYAGVNRGAAHGLGKGGITLHQQRIKLVTSKHRRARWHYAQVGSNALGGAGVVARNHDDAHASTVCFGNGACRFRAGWVDDANNACEHQVLLQQGAGLLYFVRLQGAESYGQRAQGFVRHAFHRLLRSSAVGIG